MSVCLKNNQKDYTKKRLRDKQTRKAHKANIPKASGNLEVGTQEQRAREEDVADKKRELKIDREKKAGIGRERAPRYKERNPKPCRKGGSRSNRCKNLQGEKTE